MEGTTNEALEPKTPAEGETPAAPAESPDPAADLSAPVHPTTGEPIKIIGPTCEYCGINASKCEHADAFRATGMLQKSEAMAEENKVYQNFPGLPRVIAKVCEFCGVDANECAHAEERREAAKLAPLPSRERVETDPANGAKIHIKEPKDTSVTEEVHTGEEAATIKAQVEAQNLENAERDEQPDISDEEAGDQLGALADNEGVGDEDVDID